MQRAIPRRRATLALLAIVAAMATAPFAGSNVSTNTVRTHSWCPPMC